MNSHALTIRKFESVRGAGWACLTIFAAIAIPLIVTNYDHGRAYYDQITFHLPAIRHFVAGGDLKDYSSATTPGYHLILAAVGRWVSPSESVLKLAGFLISALLVWVLGQRASRSGASAIAVIMLLLPMLLSIYFLPGGVWLLPDNLAWLSVLIVMLHAERFRDASLWYVQAAAALLLAVLARQSNVWLCIVVGAVAVLAAAATPVPGLASAVSVGAGAAGRLFRALLAALPSIGVLVYFVRLWHGMVPPSFAEQHTAFNPAAIPYFLSVIAFYGMFYLPVVWSETRKSLTMPAGTLLFWGALAGLAAAVLAPTDWSPEGGRVSGLWNLAKMFPTWHHRSVLITALSVVGGATGTLWIRLANRQSRVTLGTAAIGFAASQCLNHFVYERYYAGFVFLLLIIIVSDTLGRSSAPSRAAWAGPLAFSAFNASVLGAGIFSG